jgi:alkanesulfonate monooxygenase
MRPENALGETEKVTVPVEFIGWIAGHANSEVVTYPGPTFDPAVVRTTAQVHEQADFDRVLIGTHSIMPDGVVVGTYAAAATDRLGFLLSHRPGFAAPTVAARQIATLDHVCEGRLALHLIAGSTDQDQQRDGDYLGHADRYRRMVEYTQVLKRAWTEPEPFDFDGEFYKMTAAWSAVRCLQRPHIPIYGGGASDDAFAALVPLVDCFMLWGEPLAETAEVMNRVRAFAATLGRTLTFSLSTRPISAPLPRHCDLPVQRSGRAAAEHRVPAPAGRRRSGGSPRLVPLDRARAGHRSAGQLDVSRRYSRHGR